MIDFEELSHAIVKGDESKVNSLVKKAIDGGVDPSEIINKGLIPGMLNVGDRFKSGEIFVPEVLMSSNSMHAGMKLIQPLMSGSAHSMLGTVVLGTVKGDLHDIGKNLVNIMLEGAGFKVVNLGVDVIPEKFAEAVDTYNPDFLAMSALLTTTMMAMKETIDFLEEQGLRKKVMVLVGGAPVTEEFAKKIGADGYASDAAEAAELAKKMIKRRPGKI